jgi:hypothetical protein
VVKDKKGNIVAHCGDQPTLLRAVATLLDRNVRPLQIV